MTTQPNKVIGLDFASKISRFVDDVNDIEGLAKGGGGSDNHGMEYVPRQELDAKLETIEARMDGRLARIEDRFSSIDRQFSDMRSILSEQKNTAWKAAGAVIATFVAVFAIYAAAFDSGGDTAKVAADAQLQTSAAIAEMRGLIEQIRREQVAPPFAK